MPLSHQTLLDTLAGRRGGTGGGGKVKVRGTLRVNGRPALPREVAAVAGYVMQVGADVLEVAGYVMQVGADGRS